MTNTGPEQPDGGFEYPPLENSPPQPNPYAPVDYPADTGFPPPVYPPPGYPAPYPAYDPYRPVRPPGTNGKAIGALVSSVVGLTCCGLTSIAGVILGILAMRETRRTGQDGWGLALAGTIVGGVVIAGWLAYLLLYIALVTSNWSLV